MESHRSWVEQTVGGRVKAWTRPASGGSRETWFVEIEDADGASREVVLRVEGDGSFSGTEISLAREAVAYKALERAGIPVPRILAMNEDGTAVVMTRAEGDSDLAAFSAESQSAIMDDFVDRLAELHAVPVDRMELPGFERPGTPQEHATLDLDRWIRLSAGVRAFDPLAAYAGGWLRSHAPAQVERTCFVQGDTGPGNFVAVDAKVSAFVDMEFSHIGDPMDDLAWLLYRSASIGRDGAELLQRYARRSGLSVVEASVAFYGLAVQYRCVVTTSLAVARGGGARGLAPYILQTERYLATVAAQLRTLVGVGEETVDVPTFIATARTPWYDNVIQSLRDAVRALPADDVRDETRNTQIYVQYLRAYDSVGAQIDELDRLDLSAVFGPTVVADAEAIVAEAAQAGSAGDEAVLRGLLRRQARRRGLWAALLDRPRR